VRSKVSPACFALPSLAEHWLRQDVILQFTNQTVIDRPESSFRIARSACRDSALHRCRLGKGRQADIGNDHRWRPGGATIIAGTSPADESLPCTGDAILQCSSYALDTHAVAVLRIENGVSRPVT
jgi:hypothetical protein